MHWISNHQYLYIFSLILLVGIIFSLPIFKYIDDDKIKSTPHLNNLDSVRLFLATFVFTVHSKMATFVFTVHSKMNTIENHHYEAKSIEFLARLGVSMFFIISGYLFWKKISATDNMNWLNLYKERFFRIAPLSFFNCSIASILIWVGFRNYNINDYHFLDWFSFGLSNHTDGVDWKFTAGVYWTLVYEWGFYFSLPLLHIFRKKPFEFSIIALFLAIYIIPYISMRDISLTGITSYSCAVLFFVGIFAYELSKKVNLPKLYYEIIASISLIFIIVFKPETYNIHSPLNFFLIILFVCLLKGATFFGILNLKGFIRLGKASYSIYIMHGCICYIIFSFLYKHHHNHPILNSQSFIYIAPLTFLVICLIASLTYKYIEKPFMNLGRKIKFED